MDKITHKMRLMQWAPIIREFLKNYSGIVVTDGYQIYHSLEKEREDSRKRKSQGNILSTALTRKNISRCFLTNPYNIIGWIITVLTILLSKLRL